MNGLSRDVSMVQRYGRNVALDAEVTALRWLGSVAAICLGNGSVVWIDGDGEILQAPVHSGAVLSSCTHPDRQSIVSGGDDGRVCRVTPAGAVQEIGRFERKWVEHLISSAASGLIVAGVGREAVVWQKDASAPSHRFSFVSTVGGLALEGKGKRLAVSHYNGATLVYAGNRDSGRFELAWRGSHLACSLSGDGRYLITAAQETGLHAWQIPDNRDMRMSGYAAKTRSLSWDRRGKWLASSGDAAAIVWPFEGKTGPMNRSPVLRGQREGRLATCVAFHPRQEVLAIGYDDGVVLLVRMADEHQLTIDQPAGSITALQWNDDGSRLGWGGEDGRVGLLNMAAGE